LGQDLKGPFTKDNRVANEYMDRCSVLLVTEEMQIKTIRRHTIPLLK
jgi:hypothetical protein